MTHADVPMRVLKIVWEQLLRRGWKGGLISTRYSFLLDRTFRQDIADLIRTTYRGKSGIVYCFSKQDCETMNETLREADISAAYYHAALNSEVCCALALALHVSAVGHLLTQGLANMVCRSATPFSASGRTTIIR